jgi:hypothetical protein
MRTDWRIDPQEPSLETPEDEEEDDESDENRS